MVKMEKRKSLIFFLEWMKVLRKYDRLFRWVVVEAICDYQESGEVPDFKSYFKEEEIDTLPDGFISNAETAFSFIKEDIDRNNAKYEAICARRREWAKKGVDARNKKAIQKFKQDDNTTLSKHKVPYATYNDNENVNVNDNDNENDNGNENDILLNENNNKLNKLTTTTTKNENSKILKDIPKIQAKLKKLKNLGDVENRIFIAKDFIKNFEALGGNVNEEFGCMENALKLAQGILERWADENIEHDTVTNAYDHLINTMRIQYNINNRKLKKNGSTSKARKAKGPGRGADNRSEKSPVNRADFPASAEDLSF